MKKKKQDKEWKDKTIGLGVWSMRMWKKGYKIGYEQGKVGVLKEIEKLCSIGSPILKMWDNQTKIHFIDIKDLIKELKAKLRGKKK